MTPIGIHFVLLMLTILLVSCDASLTETITSGTSADENIEEPLTDKASKYKRELSVSNMAMKYLSSKSYDRFYSLGDSSLHQSISLDQVRSLFDRIENDLGELAEYKEGQWAFTTRNEGGVKTLYSTKIVLQGDVQAYYHFRFVLNGGSPEITAFWVDAMRPGDRVHIAIDRIIQ